ncbi:MAG: hypothetical protein CVT49_03630 [candidate division Zixibacteria bacterium HGW-Zixibacteria-1]|nr:MAG: hypothetical protein CVT49_03630 [candidate division Zixibacteria bacterium HGW-Zixibacteria-1]
MMGIISPIATDTNGNPVLTGSMQALGKDDFLQLLVAQLTHQDPLEPMDDTQFIAELAQFSSLEQLQNMNESINNSLAWDYLQMQTINNTMATSLIGRDIKATFNNIYLDEENLPKINYSTTDFASEVKIDILNMDGTVVRTLTQEDIEAGSNSIVWDGKDMNGNRLESGYYTISISATDSSGESFTPSTFVEGRVTGVLYRDGAAYLQVNGLEIALAEVTAIKDASLEDEG